ncbi:MAG: dTDP-glucose 4,6-dehydratase [Verrucomicrobiota bacterium]
MNLLVTGGAGFIGSNFIRHLLLNSKTPPKRIINLDKLTYAGNLANLADVEKDSRYVFVQGDIADRALLEKILREYTIEAVVNFAAESHVDRSIDAPEDFIQTNVVGTFRLLETTRGYFSSLSGEKKKMFRFLHVSTDEVFGSLSPADAPFHEKTPYAPNSPYAASKAASDHLARAYIHTYQLPVLVTNCSNNFGPYQFPEKLIPLMILNALDGKLLPIYGDGGNIRDWLYVEDHCRAIELVLQKGFLGETYNIGGENELTNVEVVDEICEILDRLRPRTDKKSYKTLKKFVEDRPGHDRRYAMNDKKIRDLLHWKPEETFRSALEKTVQWYLQNRSWCEAIANTKYQRERLGLTGS